MRGTSHLLPPRPNLGGGGFSGDSVLCGQGQGQAGWGGGEYQVLTLWGATPEGYLGGGSIGEFSFRYSGQSVHGLS